MTGLALVVAAWVLGYAGTAAVAIGHAASRPSCSCPGPSARGSYTPAGLVLYAVRRLATARSIVSARCAQVFNGAAPTTTELEWAPATRHAISR